jgi:hypothetical protein
MNASEAAKEPDRHRRDALGWFCYVLHLAIVVFVVTGWLSPWRGVLIFYLVLLIAMPLQWRFNRSSCVLNNIESWLRTGRWRSPHNREEGAFLLRLVERVLGLYPSERFMDVFIHALLASLWLLALSHLLWW